jgi:predicted ArsR family transcriptional regulator
MASDMERALGALRDFTRRDILLRFYADRKPRSVDDVAKEAEIHRSVAFEHLERLVALGYLTAERRRGLIGKPAKIYRLTGGPVQISHPMRRYDVLAEALAKAFEGLGDIGSHAVRRAGRTYGVELSRSGAKSPLAALEPLMEMGGEYEVRRDGIVDCTNCLFAEVCRRAPVACRFHAGVIEGLLERSGFKQTIKVLGFRDPDGCAFALEDYDRAGGLEAQAE